MLGGFGRWNMALRFSYLPAGRKHNVDPDYTKMLQTEDAEDLDITAADLPLHRTAG